MDDLELIALSTPAFERMDKYIVDSFIKNWRETKARFSGGKDWNAVRRMIFEEKDGTFGKKFLDYELLFRQAVPYEQNAGKVRDLLNGKFTVKLNLTNGNSGEVCGIGDVHINPEVLQFDSCLLTIVHELFHKGMPEFTHDKDPVIPGYVLVIDRCEYCASRMLKENPEIKPLLSPLWTKGKRGDVWIYESRCLKKTGSEDKYICPPFRPSKLQQLFEDG